MDGHDFFECTIIVGLVSKIFPADQVLDQALKTAEKIAEQAPVSVIMAKEAVNRGSFLPSVFIL